MIHLLNSNLPSEAFPDPNTAETEPNGLLAVGGDLSSTRLINAYRAGIFPWFNEDDPLLWWSPNPRMVLEPSKIKISRSLRKTLKNKGFIFKVNTQFSKVLEHCASSRKNKDGSFGGTWINDDMQKAYIELHRLGYAHSIETWLDGELVGGLYGIAIGKVFFGESMFAQVSDASKAAFFFLSHILIKNNCPLIDCQIYSDHLATLGAAEIYRSKFNDILITNQQNNDLCIDWPTQVMDSQSLTVI